MKRGWAKWNVSRPHRAPTNPPSGCCDRNWPGQWTGGEGLGRDGGGASVAIWLSWSHAPFHKGRARVRDAAKDRAGLG